MVARAPSRGGAPVPLVVDASVSVKWFLREADSDRALTLIGAAARGEVALHAPDTWLVECANAIWKQVHLAGALSPRLATQLLQQLERTGVEPAPSAGLLAPAFAIAIRHGCTVYDALYVALAAALPAALVTADEELARVARRAGVQVRKLDQPDT